MLGSNTGNDNIIIDCMADLDVCENAERSIVVYRGSQRPGLHHFDTRIHYIFTKLQCIL